MKLKHSVSVQMAVENLASLQFCEIFFVKAAVIDRGVTKRF